MVLLTEEFPAGTLPKGAYLCSRRACSPRSVLSLALNTERSAACKQAGYTKIKKGSLSPLALALFQ